MDGDGKKPTLDYSSARPLDYSSDPPPRPPFRLMPPLAFAASMLVGCIASDVFMSALADWRGTPQESVDLAFSLCAGTAFSILVTGILSLSIHSHLATEKWLWRTFPTARAAVLGALFLVPLLAITFLPDGWESTALFWIYLLVGSYVSARVLLRRNR